MTNTLKKRKTSKAAVDGETAKDGIRTFDPNILNTHVPQPTGLKITHASPNFNVRKANLPPVKKCEGKSEETDRKIFIQNDIKEVAMKPITIDDRKDLSPDMVIDTKAKASNGTRSLSSKESSPDRPETSKVLKITINSLSNHSNGVDTVDSPGPDDGKIISPTVKELKKQLSVSSQTESVSKVDKKVQKLDIKFLGSNDKPQSPMRSPKSSSPEATKVIKTTIVSNGTDTVDGQSSPSIKELKKQLSVASQTNEVKKVDKKIQKLEITVIDNPKSSDNPKKSPPTPTRPTVLRVNSTDANGTIKKIRHPVPNFTLPRKPTKDIGKLKSPVKTPTSPKTKSFQKENITFNRPTIASLQRQQSNQQKKPIDNQATLTDKHSMNVIKANKNRNHSLDNDSNEIPTNYDKKAQISFAKELSNARNYYQETVKTSKSVTTKTDLYFNNINLANVKLEINTETENVIKVVPK